MKKLFVITLLILSTLSSLTLAHMLPTSVTQHEVLNHKAHYTKYLEGLSTKLNLTPSWLRDTVARGMGFEQWECDAIPASYPFLCDKEYKNELPLLGSTDVITVINELLQKFHARYRHLSNHRQMEAALHSIIHEYMCQKLNLPASTTAKELSKLVSKGNINIRTLCRAQLAAFFVKFLLTSDK